MCGSKWFCGEEVVQAIFCTTKYCSVLQRTTPVPLCTKVLQDTTPVLLCTTKCYNVLLQYYSSNTTYYSVLQSTQCYASTNLYHKVLLQYHSLSIAPVLLRTTIQYFSVLPSTTTYYSGTALYYKVLLQHYSVQQTLFYKVLLQY